MPTTVNTGARWKANPITVLQQVRGLAVIQEPGDPAGRHNLLLVYGGKRLQVAAETKRHVNAATAWHLVHSAAGIGKRPIILIAQQTTAEARQILVEHGVGVVDGLGNAHIELPGLLLHLEGGPGRRPTGGAPPTRLRGKAGVAAQVLLIHRERLWRVSDLAAEAGVAKGLAHRVLTRLERDGVVRTDGTGPNRTRLVVDATALLDLWAEENVDKARRINAYLLAQTQQQLLDMLGRNLEQGGVEYALSGSAGASLMAPFITAIPVVEVWVSVMRTPEELHDAAKAEAVEEGPNVVFLQAKDDIPLAFKERHDNLWVADRFRLYLDLRRDPRRGRGQADHLRQEVIGF